MNLTSQNNKKIGIFGLGMTGTSVYAALEKVASEIICYDDSAESRNQFQQKFNNAILANLEDTRWQELDKIILSPGIDRKHPMFKFAKKNKIKISSDIELFIEQNPDSAIIAITGTNGKSTTASLIHHVVKEAGLDYHLGGNIGIPVLSLPHNRKGYVLELSSFQLELLEDFKPDIAILLNITADHLDRYFDIDRYTKVKEKIINGNGYKIIGVDSMISDTTYTRARLHRRGNTIPISSIKEIDHVIYYDGQQLVDKYFKNTVYNFHHNPVLSGYHNYENTAACFAACQALAMDTNKIIEGIRSFKGLKHRMQYLGKSGKIKFYNDSKGTNGVSTANALNSTQNGLWLAGGRLKDPNLTSIDYALRGVKKAYFYGESKDVFAKYFKNKLEYEICSDLKEAFDNAAKFALASNYDIDVILSPACSSYDQFKNFEARGDFFIDLAQKFIKKNNRSKKS